MTKQSLWYVRSAGQVKGPFPARTVADFILLGRLSDQDEISPDKGEWIRLRQLPDFVLDALHIDPADPAKEEKLQAALRRADERGFDTAAGEASGTPAPDRRKTEPSETAQTRHAPQETPRRRVSLLPLIIVLVCLVIISALAVLLQPPQPMIAGECLSPPGPGVNWANCRFANVDLKHRNLSKAKLHNVDFNLADLSYAQINESDLSYSNLTQAKLQYTDFSASQMKGATLRQAQAQAARFDDADLSYAIFEKANLMNASLQGANLQRANLAGANISGASFAHARLDEATWVDGTVCAPGSLGRCRRQ